MLLFQVPLIVGYNRVWFIFLLKLIWFSLVY